MRIALFLSLLLALGTVFCSTAATPPLGTCCVLTASDTSTDCYCGTFVVVSGSTCTVTVTVTVTSDGGASDGGTPLKGYPPAAVTDCMNPIGS
jgi:hypothetical protein